MNRLKRIQYNCKQATFLIEKKHIQGLNVRERVELRIHLTTCSICRIYQRQSKVINLMVHQLFQSSQQTEIHLDENYKKGLHDRIEEELNKN